MVAAATIAAGAARLFDDVLPQPPAPPGHRSRHKPVFPSGHAFGTGSVAMTAAYILEREGLILPGSAVALALGVPLLSAGGKLVEEKHWGSDVLGGLLAAVMLSSACVTAYELAGDA